MKKTKVSPCSDCLTKTDIGNFFANLLMGFVLLIVGALTVIGAVTSVDYMMTPSAAPSPPPMTHVEDHMDYYWTPSWAGVEPVRHHHTKASQ